MCFYISSRFRENCLCVLHEWFLQSPILSIFTAFFSRKRLKINGTLPIQLKFFLGESCSPLEIAQSNSHFSQISQTFFKLWQKICNFLPNFKKAQCPCKSLLNKTCKGSFAYFWVNYHSSRVWLNLKYVIIFPKKFYSTFRVNFLAKG